MKKLLAIRKICPILLLILLVSAPCAAYYDQAEIDAARQICRLENALSVYPAPNDARKPDAVLEAGAIVTLLKGVGGGWLEIGYTQNSRECTGYVLASDGLKPNGLQFDDATFFYGAETGEYGFDGFITIEALVNGREVASHTMPGHGYLDFPIFTAQPGTGLKNAELVLSYYTDPEFCAIRYNHFWIWTGAELLPLINTVHSVEPEGDWYDETLLFPRDNRQSDLVMKILFTATQFDDSNFAYVPLDPEYRIDLYEWDGEKLMEKGQNAVIQNWKEWDF